MDGGHLNQFYLILYNTRPKYRYIDTVLFRYIMIHNPYRINTAYHYRQERDCEDF